MNVLDKVKVGRQEKPMIHLIYGLPGVGKTTWASQFPNPVILDLEDGSSQLDVARIEQVDMPTYDHFVEMLDGVVRGGFKTIVIDSIESLEGLMTAHICSEGGVTEIEKYEGGYGKGWQRLRELTRELMIKIRNLANQHGVDVVLIGHSQVKTHTDPSENTAYDRYTMRVNEKMGAILRDLSDNVFFACKKVTTFKDGQKMKAFSDGESIMRTQWRAGFDAKTRITGLPYELPLTYAAFKKACENSKPLSPEELRGEIMEMLKGLDEDTRPKAEEATKKATTVVELQAIKQRIQTLVAA